MYNIKLADYVPEPNPATTDRIVAPVAKSSAITLTRLPMTKFGLCAFSGAKDIPMTPSDVS